LRNRLPLLTPLTNPLIRMKVLGRRTVSLSTRSNERCQEKMMT
jgi:hypothetical protein